MSTEELKQVGRLAMRQEGDNWVAYYAMPNSMQDAVYLGSIRMGAVSRPERKRAFMDLMREVIGDIYEDETGRRPIWKDPTAAPEHERTGRA